MGGHLLSTYTHAMLSVCKGITSLGRKGINGAGMALARGRPLLPAGVLLRLQLLPACSSEKLSSFLL